MNDLDLDKVEFFVKIVLYKGCHVDAVVYYRRYMNIDFFLRWRWYFEYITARVKVAHPKEKVEMLGGRIDSLNPGEYIEKKRESLLRAKRGQLKKIENTPAMLDLFDIAINKKQDKIARIEDEIQRLESGEVIFYVPGDHLNRVHDFVKPL